MNETDDKSIAEELAEAINVLANSHIAIPEDGVLELLHRGYSRARAEKLYLFIETAFGRVMIERLAGVVFAETYIVATVDGVQTEFKFADDPYYEHAIHIANGLVENKVWNIVRAVAVRSAELSAFSKGFENGENLEGSVFAPLRWNSNLPVSAWESFSQ